MDVPARSTSFADLNGGPPIPARGIEEVLALWSGSGQLFDALAACDDPIAQRRWDQSDIRARAERVLFAHLEPLLARWPVNPRGWLDAIPPMNERSRILVDRPLSGTDWRSTMRLGWPPQGFVSRPPRRRNDDLLVDVLAWTLRQMVSVRDHAALPLSAWERSVRSRCDVGLGMLIEHPFLDVDGSRPGRADLRGVRSVGSPWSDLAEVAGRLVALEADLGLLALELVAPDPSLAWRLFHLAVLGEVLHSLRTSGAQVTSLRPLGASGSGPAFSVTDSDGEEWDLWFEAAGAWSYYEREEPYKRAAAGVAGAGSALGCDLMLAQLDHRALLIECKYSIDGSIVARGGYLQALAYAAEANEMCGAVTSVVVGPEGVVETPGWTDALPGLIGIISPAQLPELLEHCLRGE